MFKGLVKNLLSSNIMINIHFKEYKSNPITDVLMNYFHQRSLNIKFLVKRKKNRL
jgi:hypothetical protein